MPELPEVEHVVRALAGAITGRRIVAADLKLKRLAPGTSPAVFNRKLKGARIESVTVEQLTELANEFFQTESIAVTVLGNLNGLKLTRDQLAC